MRPRAIYMADVIEEQGRLFDIVADNNYDLVSFIYTYMNSLFRFRLDYGWAWYCTRFGDEILEFMQENEGLKFKPCKNKKSQGIYKNAATWVGEFYALAQFRANIASHELVKILKPEFIIEKYSVLHDMDIDICVQKLLASRNISFDLEEIP